MPAAKDGAIAFFSDETTLQFPKGTTFAEDNHCDPSAPDKVVQVRLIVHPPKGAHFWIPRGCTKEYVKSALRRIERGI